MNNLANLRISISILVVEVQEIFHVCEVLVAGVTWCLCSVHVLCFKPNLCQTHSDDFSMEHLGVET